MWDGLTPRIGSSGPQAPWRAAASLGLAGLTACTKQPEEKIVPYVKTPEGIVPGVPMMFATAFVMEGYARGTLVRSYEGRPTKIEGNPAHPASLGATDIFTQASILTRLDAFLLKEVQDEVADRVRADRREQGALQAEPVRADADVRRRCTNFCSALHQEMQGYLIVKPTKG